MDDRREYFRIVVDACIEVAPLDAPPGQQQDPAIHFASSAVLRTMAELKKIDGESAQVQQQIKDGDRALGEYLHLLSRKVDVLALYCLTSSAEAQGDYQSVTLSEGGISFNHREPVSQHQWVAMMLIFASPPSAIALHAQVTRCEPDRDTGFDIAAEFHYSNSAQRQQISQQIMRAQMDQIRSTKG
ncbi:PilZ domain-containing protein [Gilvimarinus algae]|uniref:PilZ domain-containing protein n=1 Tax=Gilvimarinus algae TaxID=3058037 RepID=A0ABT8TF58_9GAMM|nr:PilZ domain-containing protein [Gilvimarinus sp. SDUM040014]MDO3382717.1 PilZ domain-containing protein [Gilvimarinus sp. SDUM040014]